MNGQTGRQQNSLCLFCFLPVNLVFVVAALLSRCRMSADATGIFILTGDNALPLTTFALAFSPVNPLSVAAFAALRVSFPGACPGKDGFFLNMTGRQIKTGRQRVIASLNPFSPRKPRFRRRFAPLKVSLWRRMSAVATIFSSYIDDE